MQRPYSRTPKNYDGTAVTTHHVGDILSRVMAKIGERQEQRPDLILGSWPEVIGPKLAAMTQAISFAEGILIVKVKNSTLHSLLSQHDKHRLLSSLRQRFPQVSIKTIVFRMG